MLGPHEITLLKQTHPHAESVKSVTPSNVKSAAFSAISQIKGTIHKWDDIDVKPLVRMHINIGGSNCM